MRKNCCSNYREKHGKFESEGREFAGNLRPSEQFWEQNTFSNLLQEVSTD